MPADADPHALVEGLLAAADTGMYAAKRAGRDRIVLAPPD